MGKGISVVNNNISLWHLLRLEELNKAINEKQPLSNIAEWFEINNTTEIQDIEPILQIHNEPICGLGEIMLVTGKAKSRKSTFVTLCISNILAGEKDEIIKGNLPSSQNNILYFDTEQSRKDCKKTLDKMGSVGSNLKLYELRSIGYINKKQFIEDMLKNSPATGLMVIDGIRDLVTDINDIKQAQDLSEWLLRISASYNIAIVVVLHQNKGDNNARGHLGTELVNKANSVISVTKCDKDKNNSLVSSEYCRGKDFETFYFSVDENGKPIILNINPSERKPAGRPAIEPALYPKETHIEVLKRVFKDSDYLSYTQLLGNVRSDFGSHGIMFGESVSKRFLYYYTHQDFIKKIDKKYLINTS